MFLGEDHLDNRGNFAAWGVRYSKTKTEFPWGMADNMGVGEFWLKNRRKIPGLIRIPQLI
jgi:hypothetical protein